ncbi:hypothetical protein HUT18_29440 [Streptomyces sp. NA04227]|uniref:hypothetical protein n=1 Tax=Streptomyces sp. NA04227 TaxID=2742136 RepID=UPI001592A62C|nr:hypothetical protein [Streptomyces sp. NA04227]QKW09922.1 hypothetical protein HUT18_29440 [Streptomyces sp. NA04227]
MPAVPCCCAAQPAQRAPLADDLSPEVRVALAYEPESYDPRTTDAPLPDADAPAACATTPTPPAS